MKVPSESTTITGCWAAAKSPTTGITLITNGVCDVSETNACWPLNKRDLGGLEDVRPLVALGGIDEEVGLDVAEDRESHRGSRLRCVETAELRHRQGIAALLEGDAQVRGEDSGLGRGIGRCPAACRGSTFPLLPPTYTRGHGALRVGLAGP